jgi:hypothetical protein
MRDTNTFALVIICSLEMNHLTNFTCVGLCLLDQFSQLQLVDLRNAVQGLNSRYCLVIDNNLDSLIGKKKSIGNFS